MKTQKTDRIYLKMIAAILLPSLIVFGTIGLMTMSVHKRTLMKSMNSEADTVVRLLQKISLSSFRNFEYTTLDEYAQEAVGSAEIISVRFYDSGGKLLSKAEDGDNPADMMLEGKILDPSVGGGALLGSVQIGYNTDNVKAILRREVLRMVLYGLAGFVIFSVAALLMTGRLIRRQRQALDTTETILTHLPFGMVVVGKDKTIRMANQAALSIMRIEQEKDLVGKVCHNNICPAEECNCPVLDNAQVVDSSERVVLDRDGRSIPVMKSVIRIELNGEEVLLEAFADITDLKEAQKALQAGEKKLLSVMEACADPIIVYDREGLATYLNPAFERVFGWPPEELLGKRIDFVPEAEKPKAAAGIADILKGIPHYGMETVRLTRDGERKAVRLSAAPILDESEVYAGMVVNLQDVSDMVRARQAAEKANEELERAIEEAERLAVQAESASIAKSEFLANMSHEIRTPMNGVIGMTSLLLTTELNPEQLDYTETIRKSADSLLAIINDILDYSKIEAGKLELEIIDFDLRVTMEEMADLLALRAYEKGLEFGMLFQRDVPVLLRGDPGRIRQVLINLVGNAVKFTEEGQISVEVRLEEESETGCTLHFAVTDTGIGIPEERKKRLFEKFSQVDGSTARRYGGTGLGLSISKRLVELMGGRIGVDSADGKGSTFWFRVVLDKQPACNQPAALIPGDIRGMRILVVDDNLVNRRIFREQLMSWECRVTEAVDGFDALACLRRAASENSPFDMALIDMQMPGMDGEALGREIKADPRLKATRLIMVTSIGDRGDAAKFRAIGFAGYLTKPLKQSQLFDCLAAVAGIGGGVAPAQRTAPLVTRHFLAENRKRNVRILLVEDDSTNRKVALNILNKFGYPADSVADGREAVSALQTVPYDLVLMDVQMPVMDGYSATAAIRANPDPRVSRTPIIAMTAHAMQGDRQRCLEAGMNDYTTKPIIPKDLRAKIDKWLPAFDACRLPPDRQEGAPAPEEPAAFRLEEALDRCMGDRDLLKCLCREFLDTLPQALSTLRSAAERNDSEAVIREGHTLKGTAANLSMTGISSVALKIETAGRAGEMPAVVRLTADLEEERRLLADHLRNLTW